MSASTARRSAATAAGYTVLCSLPLFLLSALAVELQRDLDFDRVRLGWCVSTYFLVSSLASATIGSHLERTGPAAGLRASVVLSVVVLLGAAVARSWVHLALCMAGSGLANAVAQVSSNLVVAGGVPTRRLGIAFGVKQSAVPLGSVLAGLALPTAGVALGWRWTFAAAAAATAPAVLLRTRQAGGGRRRPGDRAPRNAELLLLLVAAGCAGGMGNGLATFTVDAAVTGGMAQGTAGLLLSLGAGVAIATRLSSGWLADRRDSAGFAELATLMLVGAGGTILLALGGSHPALVVAGTLVAFAGAWGWQGLVYYAVVRRYPESPAASTGLVQSGVYLGTILGPPLIGHLATASSYRVAWTAAGGLLAAGAAGVVLTRYLAARRPRSTLPAGGGSAG